MVEFLTINPDELIPKFLNPFRQPSSYLALSELVAGIIGP